MLPIVLALLAAALNACASVLQRRANRDEPDQRAFSIRLLLDLLTRPVWLAGILSVLLGFLLQAAALAVGRIALVQPLLVAELPFTLLLASVVFRIRIGRRDWTAIAALALGLAGFVVALSPSGGDPLHVPLTSWLLALAGTLIVAGVLVVAGVRSRGPHRAAWLGIATGVGFGLTAALVAGVGAAYQHGLAGVATAWQTYAVLVVGPLSFFLLQNALQAGNLVASQPGMTLANPLVAVVWGLVVFDEHGRGGVVLAGELAGAALVVAGTVLLARSPLLSDKRPSDERSGEEQPERSGDERSGKEQPTPGRA